MPRRPKASASVSAPAASVKSGAPGGLVPPPPFPPGQGLIAGTDEAGRGCLAGPVMAAAVILPASFDLPGLTDSKKLTPEKRETLFRAITAQAVTWAVAARRAPDIDAMNILAASLDCMARAVGRLSPRPDFVYVDGNKTFPGPVAQAAVVDGDALVPAISAASILAKVLRDRVLDALDRRWPGYGFARHKGYGTREHLAAIRKLGPSPVHRMTFAGVRPESDPGRVLCLPGI